jgi:uncharacterized protein YbjT (DUF2867 family)
MSQPILVFGALGNAGAEVVKALQADGASIRAADLDVEAIRKRFGGRVEAVRFDFTDNETFPTAVQGVKGMFLMRPPQISDVERLMFPAIDAAQAAGVQQAVFLSLIGIENNRGVPHYKVEQRLRSSGMNWTFLRASFFMQNFNTTHRQEIKERNEIFVPVGSGKTSFIDVRDIGAVAALALTQPGHAGRAYDLTGPEALDYYEAAERFSQVLGRRITYRNPSLPRFVWISLRSGRPLAMTLVMAWLYRQTRRGMSDQVSGEVQRLLGRPPIPLSQYIEDYRSAWM